tara:strand:+ start:509 stop:940 length:432 start_codon:yes stop_codon:yes gene_type:complete
MKPASADQLGDAFGACLQATQGEGEIDAALTTSGWKTAEMSSDSKAIENGPLTIFGKAGNRALIMTSSDDDADETCVVLARLRSTERYLPSAEGISRAIGEPANVEDGTYFWTFDGRVAQLAPTGSREEPSLRFVVMKLKDQD